jgi:hypothetical protein
MMELDDQSPETIEYKAISGKFGDVRYFISCSAFKKGDSIELNSAK